ncbi:hypothetical protein BDV93DRAFT_506850 [Ceratobasidium sp. AG-I]|nr:hypothetical protein BDV93DRAFT_506850 [Ceratobasidium sp. AG-I]
MSDVSATLANPGGPNPAYIQNPVILVLNEPMTGIHAIQEAQLNSRHDDTQPFQTSPTRSQAHLALFSSLHSTTKNQSAVARPYLPHIRIRVKQLIITTSRAWPNRIPSPASRHVRRSSMGSRLSVPAGLHTGAARRNTRWELHELVRSRHPYSRKTSGSLVDHPLGRFREKYQCGPIPPEMVEAMRRCPNNAVSDRNDRFLFLLSGLLIKLFDG